MNHNNSAVNDKRGREYVLKTLDELGVMLGAENSAGGAAAFRALVDEFSLDSPHAEKSLVEGFAASVNPDRLLNNPTTLSSADVEIIYKRVFKINE